MNDRTVTLTYRNLLVLVVLPWILLVGLFVGSQAQLREVRADMATLRAAQDEDVKAYAEILSRLNRIIDGR